MRDIWAPAAGLVATVLVFLVRPRLRARRQASVLRRLASGRAVFMPGLAGPVGQERYACLFRDGTDVRIESGPVNAVCDAALMRAEATRRYDVDERRREVRQLRTLVDSRGGPSRSGSPRAGTRPSKR